MATTKKTTKKAPAAKAPVKKAAPKKAATRAKAAPKTVSTKATKSTQLESFKPGQNQPPFSTFKITRQTVYWIILVAFIVFAQLWILKLQMEVATLLDAQQAIIENL